VEGGGARRGRPGYDQQTVLRRAVEVFNRQGYDGTSMGDLARELGVGKSALYHHVPGKSHLLAQALDEALDGLTAVLDAAAADRPAAGENAVVAGDRQVGSAAGGTAYERLRAAVRDSVRVLVEHLPAVTLLLRVRGNSEVELAALRRRREIDDRLAALVSAAVAEGSLRADLPPDLVSRLLFGMVNSLVEWYRPGGPVDAGVLADTITTLAFDGLKVQAS
jgi:AcrR family transcriptional regulator